jgi:hypothetical protein
MTNVMPCFFTPYREYAESYGNIINTFYLDILKPFALDSKQAVDIYNNEFIPYADKKGWSNGWDEKLRHVKIGDMISFAVADYLYPFLRRMKRQGKYDYDGMIVDEGVKQYSPSYIPFDKSQIHDIV